MLTDESRRHQGDVITPDLISSLILPSFLIIRPECLSLSSALGICVKGKGGNDCDLLEEESRGLEEESGGMEE